MPEELLHQTHTHKNQNFNHMGTLGKILLFRVPLTLFQKHNTGLCCYCMNCFSSVSSPKFSIWSSRSHWIFDTEKLG